MTKEDPKIEPKDNPPIKRETMYSPEQKLDGYHYVNMSQQISQDSNFIVKGFGKPEPITTDKKENSNSK